MQKEFISVRQAICVIALFIFGSSVVMGVNSEVKQDSWIALLLAAVMALPMVLVYARIMKLYPEKDIFEIMEMLFGKIAGKGMEILFIWYALHLAALVLRNFSEFIQIVSIPETPQLPVMIGMIAITVYLAKSGIESLGKWCLVMTAVIMFVVLFTVAISFNRIEFTNLLPIAEHDFASITASAYQIFTFPFAETVIFLGVASAIKKHASPYKLYIYGILFSAAVLLIIILRNIALLGADMINAEYFPSYIAVRLINIGDFFARVEGSISMNFILAGITKITLCLIAASRGFARLFEIDNYREIVLPMGLLVIALGSILYQNIMQMFEFIKTYEFYAVPFSVGIPLAIWITAEVKQKKKKTGLQNQAAT